MKKNLIVIIVTFISINAYTQRIFEKGYFIDNTNKRTDCLIKDEAGKNNPNFIKYKLSDDGEVKKATIKDIKEFGRNNNTSKFIRKKVKIDISSETTNELTHQRDPIFSEEQLFLRVLLEGKANLYSYESHNLTRYFFSVDSSDIEQLIYKCYIVNGNEIYVNDFFRHQLMKLLKCPDFSFNQIMNIEYKKNDLIDIFVKYNECKSSKYITYKNKRNRASFNLNIRPGIMYSSLSLDYLVSDSRSVKFNNKLNFRFGIEAEVFMPFKKKKLSVILEPNYQYFISEKSKDVVFPDNSEETIITKVNLNSIAIPIGARYYFFLNDKSKLFINASYVVQYNFNSTIKSEQADGHYTKVLEINPDHYLALGIGYKLKDKFSIEFRYQTDQNLLWNYSSWDSKYKTMSVILGYTLF